MGKTGGSGFLTSKSGSSESVEILTAASDLATVAAEWDRLAWAARSPFLTTDWLRTWWDAFGEGAFTGIVARGSGGELRAGTCFASRARHLVGAANYHSGAWGLVAADEVARDALLASIGQLGARSIVFPTVDDESAAASAERTLATTGYRVAVEAAPPSPYLALPSRFDDLLASASRNLRSQFQRKSRVLAREGAVALRTVRTTDALNPALDAFFAIEGSGWKTRGGTAILADPRVKAFYTAMAALAAERGWLRLRLLELDGAVVAGDFSLAYANGEFLLKTGFDTRYASFSPGLVLRGEVIRAAIGEGLEFYDFLGGPDSYKLRWTSELRPRVTLRAYRGMGAGTARFYRARIRPLLKSLRRRG
jgi:CelD/BcsL family acetyltransferase involved in cellulose biosynthesis